MEAHSNRIANQSALMYPAVSHNSVSSANLSLAAFLVTRGPYSFQPANQAIIEGQDRANPFFQLFQLHVGPWDRCTFHIMPSLPPWMARFVKSMALLWLSEVVRRHRRHVFCGVYRVGLFSGAVARSGPVYGPCRRNPKVSFVPRGGAGGIETLG